MKVITYFQRIRIEERKRISDEQSIAWGWIDFGIAQMEREVDAIKFGWKMMTEETEED